MYGVWVNAAAVIVGGLIGTVLRGGIPARFRDTIQNALALCVLLIGISGAIATKNLMCVIICAVAGAFLGELIRLEDRLEKLGDFAQRKLAKNDDGFSRGFVSATLLFCIGAMAVVGSLEAGLSGKGDTLLAKSILDGVSSIIFASTLGPGVILSALPMTLYQGGIALLSTWIAPVLSDAVVTEMSAVGGVLIIGLSINMLGMTKEKLKVGNMLPAILLPVAYIPLTQFFSRLF